MRMLDTAIGRVSEAELEHEHTEEDVPCGRAITDTWRSKGQVVKQDVTIIANNAQPANGQTGALQ